AKQEAAKQEAAKQEAAKQEAAKQEAAKQEAAKQEAAKQEAAKPAKPSKPVVKKPTPPPEPVQEISLVDTLLDSVSLPMLGSLGGLGLLSAGWMYLRNRRKKDLDSFERGILTSGGLRANTVFGSTTGNSSVSDSSFLTDFAQSADGSMIDTNDVDPIAEAEVYMAYGRDAQAEEILKDAITKEPKRYELHLKLLELYANNKDAPSFETIAGELYTTLGAADPVWAKVIALGVTVEPSNPLYDASRIENASVDDTQKLDAADFSNVAVASQPDLDLTFDDVSDSVLSAEEDANSVVMESFSDGVETESSGLAFDLGMPDEAQGDALPELNMSVNDTASFNSSSNNSLEADASNLMDFDLSEFSSNDAVKAEQESMKTMDNLPAFDIETVQADNAESLGLPSFDLQFEQAEPTVASAPETKTSLGNEISFDFDVLNAELLADADDVEPKSDESNPLIADVNTIDFSGIDLDLNATENTFNVDTLKTSPITMNDFADTAQNDESKDIDVKLDLVQAYIEMGDKEGAKELLDEVLKEGSSAQQIKAKQVLKQLT
ncbi:MAG: hypothetical protein HOP21_00295, partial [Methylotenera sp.]|nr:hypothetical protein [Methylotenera sp.]